MFFKPILCAWATPTRVCVCVYVCMLWQSNHGLPNTINLHHLLQPCATPSGQCEGHSLTITTLHTLYVHLSAYSSVSAQLCLHSTT